MNEDPRILLASAPMGRFQIAAIGICVLLNALDGFDVLAISFAAPGIAALWPIDRALLGFVLSMELIGMAVGSITLGIIADRCGRRPTILLCISVMALGMALSGNANSIESLSAYRFLTGLGIGRGGVALGPIIAGAMFEASYSLSVGALSMALGSLVALVSLLFLPTHAANWSESDRESRKLYRSPL